jgi:hypothetical protein
MARFLHVDGAMGHFQHAKVLDLGVAREVVLRDASMHTFPATDAAREVQGLHILDAVQGLEIAHMRAQAVLALHLVFNPPEHVRRLYRR